MLQNGAGKIAHTKRVGMRQIWNCRWLYLMLIPVLANFIIFHYVPFKDIVIAFKRYNVVLGMANSPWVGFENFENLFRSYYFVTLIRNTLTISIVSILLGFPCPILLALLMNESPSRRYRKFAQTATYLPYFVSVVVVAGMFKLFLSVEDGIVNKVIQAFGLSPVNFLTDEKWFIWVYMMMIIWRWTGYDSIIHMASMASIDPMLYDAAQIDGAGRFGRIWHVTLPGIRGTIIILFIMRLGGIMSLQWQDILLMQNDLNLGTSEVLQTYVYKRGLQNMDYSYSTAAGLFQSVVGFVMLLLANWVCRRVTDTSLF